MKGGPPPRGSFGPHGWNFTNLTAWYHSVGLKLGMYVTGGFEAVYEHEAEWAEVMFNEWNADGLKVDHMCQGASCGSGTQVHELLACDIIVQTSEMTPLACFTISRAT